MIEEPLEVVFSTRSMQRLCNEKRWNERIKIGSGRSGKFGATALMINILKRKYAA
jgi:hypothetical protein